MRHLLLKSRLQLLSNQSESSQRLMLHKINPWIVEIHGFFVFKS